MLGNFQSLRFLKSKVFEACKDLGKGYVCLQLNSRLDVIFGNFFTIGKIKAFKIFAICYWNVNVYTNQLMC